MGVLGRDRWLHPLVEWEHGARYRLGVIGTGKHILVLMEGTTAFGRLG